METSNIHQRIILAKKEIRKATIDKVKGSQYPYLPIEAMKPIVADAENNAGICRVVHTGDIRELDDTGLNILLTLRIELINADDPEDRVFMEFTGHGRDSFDKAYNKGYTYALKNYFKSVYDIAEANEDPDGHQPAPVKVYRPKQNQKSNDPFFATTEPAKASEANPASGIPAKRFSEKENRALVALLVKDTMMQTAVMADLKALNVNTVEELTAVQAETLAAKYRRD